MYDNLPVFHFLHYTSIVYNFTHYSLLFQLIYPIKTPLKFLNYMKLHCYMFYKFTLYVLPDYTLAFLTFSLRGKQKYNKVSLFSDDKTFSKCPLDKRFPSRDNTTRIHLIG